MLISLTSPNIETICEKEPVWALFRWWGTCWLIAAVLSFECVKICSAVVCREDVWAANAGKRYWLPKTKFAGSQILEKLGSKRGEEVPAAQKQARGKPIQASKKLINCLTDTEKCVMVITVSIFMT